MSDFSSVPTILTVFGATGDLMTKKIVPSLFYLYQQKQLPSRFRVVGVSRREMDDAAFRAHVFKIIQEKSSAMDNVATQTFLSFFHFVSVSFEDLDDYKNLGIQLTEIDEAWQVCSNKLFYLAVAPQFLAPIVNNLKKSKLSEPCGGDLGWSRFIIEKPFGHDAKTAAQLEKVLASFKDEQVYRIDHYMGKEMVRGIMDFRFANNLFEHLWNHEHVERIDMTLFEEIGAEDRGPFYETVGALRDVGQNHLLALVALLMMDAPLNRSAAAIREARTALLQALHIPNHSEAKEYSQRAQYEGYQKINGVAPDSQVETYFKVLTHIDNDRWGGVPITLEGGKRMGIVDKKIVVTMKPVDAASNTLERQVQNRITFSLHPEQGITVEFWSQKPGFKPELEEKNLQFMLYKKKDGRQYVEEYAKLLLDAMRGDQTWFLGKEEVAAMWRVIDPITTAWQKNLVPLLSYKPDTVPVTPALEKKPAIIENRIGFVGLGKMGGSMVERLLDHNWKVTVYNRSPESTNELAKKGARPTYSLKELVADLPSPKIVWLMVPSYVEGKKLGSLQTPVDTVLFGEGGLIHLLKKGDIVIDGGNSWYKDTILRAKKLTKAGIHLVDVGVSGGPGGARHGACLMIGGDANIVEKLTPLFTDLSAPDSFVHFAGSGSGHFVKMVHNGIEYGMMQSLAEGFTLLKKSRYKLNLLRVAHIYNHGSVIVSRLVGWLESGFKKYGVDLKEVSGSVASTSEGAWTVLTANEHKVSAPSIKLAVDFRKASMKKPSYTGKILSLLRNQFGHHALANKHKK